MIIFFTLILIIAISLYTFYPSFNLAVFGDFWVTVWRYQIMAGELSTGVWNHFTYFFTLYGPQDIITGLLFKIFHYNSSYYYFFSYILRLIASFSFYPLAYYLTKNKLASFFAVLFFSVTSSGLQTTDWVFNMPSYLTISFFNLFLYFFLISRSSNKVKYKILFTSFFFISLVISPIRSLSITPFIITFEAIWLISQHTISAIKKVIIRVSILSLLYILLLTQTTLYVSPSWDKQQVVPAANSLMNDTFNSFKNGYNLIRKGEGDFIFNPIITIGGMFIPNISVSNKQLSLTVGVLVIVIWLSLIAIHRKSPFKDILLLSFLWTMFSFLIPWLRTEYLAIIFPTDHRYLILPAGGICLFFAGLISLAKNKKSKYIVYPLLFFLLIINIHSTRSYFQDLENYRSQQLYNKLWSQFPVIERVGQTKETLIFYFTGERADIVHNVLAFGFPSKLQIIYHISDFRTIITTSDFNEIVSAVKDGKSLEKFGLSTQPLPIENIYGINLEGKDKLVNTTDLTRNQILKVLNH